MIFPSSQAESRVISPGGGSTLEPTHYGRQMSRAGHPKTWTTLFYFPISQSYYFRYLALGSYIQAMLGF